jgi:pilus assembly protein Flp/PilA
MVSMIDLMISLRARFVRDEGGLALTEYLILLGILSAVVIAAVFVFGQNLGAQWSLWAQWFAPQNFSAISSP